MTPNVLLLSIPGLRSEDLAVMPELTRLVAGGDRATFTPGFPAVTWPVQANMLTGRLPEEHGVVANGFYWREKHEVEMWTAGNEVIQRPQIWDVLHAHDDGLTSAAWFPMLSKRSGADYVCMPAPVHNPDGSESLWCYTKPTELYGDLRDTLGHFPLQHFWGPMANVKSSAWIADSAVEAASRFTPNFFYIYLPQLDYAAQRTGPDSEPAQTAVAELDALIGALAAGMAAAYDDDDEPLWLVASEYTIVPVDHVTYPNRLLREAGLLSVCAEKGVCEEVRAEEGVREEEGHGGELIDFETTPAWAMVDHQFSHVFVKDRDDAVAEQVARLFRGVDGIAEVLEHDERAKYGIAHERAGDVILVSAANSWQAYYYWLDDREAPSFARAVDIHRKPGYDPVELHFDPATKGIPLDATLIGGSHGAPAASDAARGVLLASRKDVLGGDLLEDTDVAAIVLRQFGL